MRIEIKSEVPNTYEKFSVEINESDIVFDLKKYVFAKIEGKIPIEQIEVYFFKDERDLESKVALDNNSLNVFEFYPDLKKVKTVYIKDKGKQVNIVLVNLIEYTFPMVFILIFIYFKGVHNLNVIQKYSIFMIFFHFLKRDFESFYVHIHSKQMEFYMMVLEFVYYIVYFGIFCGFNLIFEESENDNNNVNNIKSKYIWNDKRHYTCLMIFIISEICNFQCHLILRKLRIDNFNKNSKEIKIPKGNLFRFVYKANYFWEICVWFSIAFFIQLKSFYGFAILGGIIMAIWAVEKKRKFDDKFGKNIIKKAIIPFIL